MALVTEAVPRPYPISLAKMFHNTNPAVANSTAINAATDELAVLWIPEVDVEVETFYFRTGSSIVDTNGIRVSIQDSSTGDTILPNGTERAYRVFTGLAANTHFNGILSSDGTDTGTLTTLTRGTPYWIVFEFETFNAGDSFILAYTTQWMLPNGTPIVNTTDNWTTVSGTSQKGLPSVGFKDSGSSWVKIHGTWLYQNATVHTVNLADNPDEYGLLFTVPYNCSVNGAIGTVIGDATGRYTLTLAESDGTVLESITGANNTNSGLLNTLYGTSNPHSPTPLYFTSDHNLTAGTEYVLAARATNAANLRFRSMEVPEAAYLTAYFGGETVHMVTREGGSGAYTDDTVEFLYGLVPLINAVDIPAGGGLNQSLHSIANGVAV